MPGRTRIMKMKKVLPLLLAAVMAVTGVPLAAYASETADVAAEQTESTEGDVQFADTTGASEEEQADASETGAVEAAAEETGTDVQAEETPQAEPVSEPQTQTDKVVTLGENLTQEQRNAMYQYFGTSPEEVRTIVVTHADEVKYMEGIATAEQIGATTNSCAYVEPTESGGIKVKTANLNYVTSTMIASTLTTAGMENCNVIAACPFEVSGTGALTGIIMAYESASGETLDEGKKEAAMAELIATGNLADALGSELASEVMNEVKTEIIDEGLTDPEEIGEAVDQIAENHDVTLTEEQRQQIVDLMEQISKYDYDINVIKQTLDSLNGKVGALENAWNSIKSFFVGTDDGILGDTNDAILGEDVITDSTVEEGGFKDGLITRILNFFRGE